MRLKLSHALVASALLIGTAVLPSDPVFAAPEQPKAINVFEYEGTTLILFGGTFGWTPGTINLELRFWQNTTYLVTWRKTCEIARACALTPRYREVDQKGLTFTFSVSATRPTDGTPVGVMETKQITT